MASQFVFVRPYEHQVDCFCPDQSHCRTIEFRQKDCLTITSDKRHVDVLGWYFLVGRNNEDFFYINIEDLENLYMKGFLYSKEDLELRLNYLQYKINEALDQRNEEAFHSFSTQLQQLTAVTAQQ
ncbi:IDEAL domain-containing protein [Bacillus sp. FJAT-42315]|uniref:IDEAL domain-containing protein n=1 Tax=Bacillus sp. FJAT-42315 TaxID=2014077 RepID=UPI000C249391|nr:IDEAL domain-containing protein [Bacillus sp. FJAT-42315]